MLTGASGCEAVEVGGGVDGEVGADGAGAGGLEVEDGLGLLGLGDVEVFLLEVGDDVALGVGDDYVEDDEAGGALDGEGAVGVFCGLGAYGGLLGRLGRSLAVRGSFLRAWWGSGLCCGAQVLRGRRGAGCKG